jgi:5-hydroxyisourate hydrolase
MDGTRKSIFGEKMDEGGRLSKEISEPDDTAVYELVFKTGDYFKALAIDRNGPQISNEVVIRFEMKDPDGKYHIPLMLSPNSYSVWWSA